MDENGFYRLETTRIESLEVTEQILTPHPIEITDVTQDSSCFEIISVSGKQEAELVVSSAENSELRPACEVLISLPSLD